MFRVLRVLFAELLELLELLATTLCYFSKEARS